MISFLLLVTFFTQAYSLSPIIHPFYQVESDDSPDNSQQSLPVIYLLLSFFTGLILGYSSYYLYKRFSPNKFLRSLYERSFSDLDGNFGENTPLCDGTGTDSSLLGYGTEVNPQPEHSQRKYSISHPITFPRVPPTEDLLPTLQPLPPLPDLGEVVLETEARWRNFHRKKGLADSILQHSTEPPLGRQLRMAVRSCLHLAEVSPESIAVDQTLHPWESWGVPRSVGQNSAGVRGSQLHTHSLLRKLGHRHSKSTASISSNPSSLRGKTQDVTYSSHGSVLMSGDSLRIRQPPETQVLPKASPHKPLFVEVFSDPEETSDSEEACDKNQKLPTRTLNKVPKRPLRPRKGGLDSQPTKSALRIETTINEKNSFEKSRSVKFDDASIGSSILFGGKNKPNEQAPASTSPSKPLLDRHFFTDETTYDWNLPNYGRIRFTDHAPVAFRLIRRYFGYSLGDFDRALSAPFGSVTTTAGKSEAIFFLTHNNAKFMFKTLRNSEPDNLKVLLPEYLEHIRRSPNTLLPRYLGMYTFERLSSTSSKEPPSPAPQKSGFGPGGATMTAIEAAVAAAFPLSQQQTLPSTDDAFPTKMVLVAMANVFDTPLTIHERYDFKGSNVGRHTLPVSTTNVPPTAEERRQEVGHLTLKDLDFQYRVFQGLTNLIHLGPQNKQELMAQLEVDLGLLKRFALMDYSVLVGIHRPQKTPPTMPTPTPSVRVSRSGSIASTRNCGNSPLSSPRAQPSLIPPFFSSASNLLSSILLPGTSPSGKEPSGTDYFGEGSPRRVPPLDSEDYTVWQGGVRSVRLPNSEVYFIGIIDILQKFTIVKWLEKGLKGYNARLLGGGHGNSTPLFSTPATTPATALPNSEDMNPKYPKIPSQTPVPEKPTPGGRKYSLSSSIPKEVSFLPSTSPPDSDLKTTPPQSHFKGPCAKVQRSRSSPQGTNLKPALGPSTPYPTPKMGASSANAGGFPFASQQTEYSVEEPGRYAERLMEYIRGIVV